MKGRQNESGGHLVILAKSSLPDTIFAPFHCPIARSLSVGRSSILRDLVRLGPRRFHDLERSLTGISPNMLSMRLKLLEEARIVERRFTSSIRRAPKTF